MMLSADQLRQISHTMDVINAINDDLGAEDLYINGAFDVYMVDVDAPIGKIDYTGDFVLFTET